MRSRIAMLALAGCGFSSGGTAIDAAAVVVDGAIDAPTIDDAPTVFMDAQGTCLESAWCKRKRFTVHGAQIVGGPHAQFTVLVDEQDPDVMASARADGKDLRFVAADGVTALPYERAVWTGGHLVAWVKVPTLAHGTDTTFYLYWGNASATEQAMRAQAWEAGYHGVWHFEEASGATLFDSTASTNNGAAKNGVMLGQAGVVGVAPKFDGNDDQIFVADNGSLQATSGAGTISAWVKPIARANPPIVDLVVSNGNTFSSMGAQFGDAFSLGIQSDGDLYFYPWTGKDSYDLITKPFTAGSWSHVAVTLDNATKTVVLYVDGVAKPNAETHTDQWTATAAPTSWMIGSNDNQTGQGFSGQLDELRVSTVVRGAAWIATEYASQHAPHAFYAKGALEQLQP